MELASTRSAATAIQNLPFARNTSIGNGVALGRNTLNPVTGYDQRRWSLPTAENTPLMIADVLGSINDGRLQSSVLPSR